MACVGAGWFMTLEALEPMERCIHFDIFGPLDSPYYKLILYLSLNWFFSIYLL